MEDPFADPVRPVRVRPLDAVAWSAREVEDAGFTGGPLEDQTLARILSSLPAWAVISAGGVVAAILGALVGGALHI